MIRFLLAFALLLGLAAPAPARRRPAALPRVAIETSEGTIVVALDTRRAPITANNFLRYVDAHKFDGTTFYRAARARSDPHRGLVQGGIDNDMTRAFLPIRHEPTNLTGIKHTDGVISMARHEIGTASGNFFIVIGPGAGLDAAPNYPGYAAFGHVLRGMDVARRILAKPTFPGGYSAVMMGQTIRRPVRIISVRRLG